MKETNKKYKELCKEITWRFKESDYKADDKGHVVIHETIDKDVSFVSINKVEVLSNELGTIKVLEIEQSYIDEFGEMPTEKKGFDKLRLLLYWYFEQRVYNDNEMRKVVNISKMLNQERDLVGDTQ